MAEIGKALREARLARGMTLEDVARSLKIRTVYLRALESESWELLPGSPYERGFLRTYATFLGLDDHALVREYERRREAPVAPTLEIDTPPVGRGRKRGALSVPRGAILAGVAVALLLGILLTLGLTGGSKPGGQGGGGNGAGASGTTTSTAERPPTPASVSVRLQASGLVWVCLVDDRGRAAVNGVTLSTGEVRGPYRARSFKLTLGNGQAQMQVAGKPVPIPAAAEPLGYEISPSGVRQLPSTARPTCT
jgi:cytoskeleton protein RodZ